MEVFFVERGWCGLYSVDVAGGYLYLKFTMWFWVVNVEAKIKGSQGGLQSPSEALSSCGIYQRAAVVLNHFDIFEHSLNTICKVHG